MTVDVTALTSNLMADTLVTAIGANALLKLFNAADGELATMTYTGTPTVTTVTGAEVLTWDEGNFTDEADANAGTVSYAVIQNVTGPVEHIRLSDPVVELSLSSLNISAGDDVNVTADVVVRLPDST